MNRFWKFWLVVGFFVFTIKLFPHDKQDNNERGKKYINIKPYEIIIDCHALPEIVYKNDPDIYVGFIFGEMVLSPPLVPQEMFASDGSISVAKRVKFELKKDNKTIPIKIKLTLDRNMSNFYKEYHFTIPVKALQEGKYSFEINVNKPGRKTLVFKSANKYYFTVKKAVTDEEKDEQLFNWATARYLSLNEKIKILHDALNKRKIKTRNYKIGIMTVLSSLNVKQNHLIDAAALSLLWCRSNKFRHDQKNFWIYGRVIGIPVGWGYVNKHKNEIEKRSIELKNKYFPELKYVYPPDELNVTSIYKEYNKITQEEKKTRAKRETLKKQKLVLVEKMIPGIEKLYHATKENRQKLIDDYSTSKLKKILDIINKHHKEFHPLELDDIYLQIKEEIEIRTRIPLL